MDGTSGEDATRRLRMLRAQVEAAAAEQDNVVAVQRSATAGTTAEDADVSTYAVPLPEKLTPDGPWQVFRSAVSPTKLRCTYAPPDDRIFTLYDNWETSISRYPHVPCLGWRKQDSAGKPGPYQWITYSQAGDIRTAIGSGMVSLGIPVKSAVGLYSLNCKEWVLLDSACQAYSMTAVPLYDTLGPDTVEYIVNHAELAAVGCSAQVLDNMLTALPKCPNLKFLIVWGLGKQRPPSPPAGCQCRIIAFDQLEALGRRHSRPHVPPSPADVAIICYTSGTTGVPKGAVITHANLIANSAGCQEVIPGTNPGERYISYLPLAHIYERNNLTTCLHLGSSVGFYSGDIQLLLEDIAELRPHMFCSVPRLWNRIYDRVMTQIRTSNIVKRRLFEAAYEYKKRCLAAGDLEGGRLGRFYDMLVFSKIRARLGGQVKCMVSGASPLSEEVMTFLRICFGIVVLEGYGMTEAACTITCTTPDDLTTGHVGPPIPSCEVKLADIPEMGYTSADKPYPRGEICVRGPTVFQGYLKDETQTRETIDEDGWLHTGDVGTWLPGGRLKIIDRKKNIFKLAQGEYIAPEKIENVYARSSFVLQSFVYGDSLRPQLVAVVVPDPEVLLPWAAQRSLPQSLPELCEHAAVRAAVLKSMLEEGRAAQLKGFEQVAAIHLVAEPFSVENGLLTPTFKLKRPQAKLAYLEAIQTMYDSLSERAGGVGGRMG